MTFPTANKNPVSQSHLCIINTRRRPSSCMRGAYPKHSAIYLSLFSLPPCCLLSPSNTFCSESSTLLKCLSSGRWAYWPLFCLPPIPRANKFLASPPEVCGSVNREDINPRRYALHRGNLCRSLFHHLATFCSPILHACTTSYFCSALL